MIFLIYYPIYRGVLSTCWPCQSPTESGFHFLLRIASAEHFIHSRVCVTEDCASGAHPYECGELGKLVCVHDESGAEGTRTEDEETKQTSAVFVRPLSQSSSFLRCFHYGAYLVG